MERKIESNLDNKVKVEGINGFEINNACCVFEVESDTKKGTVVNVQGDMYDIVPMLVKLLISVFEDENNPFACKSGIMSLAHTACLMMERAKKEKEKEKDNDKSETAKMIDLLEELKEILEK